MFCGKCGNALVEGARFCGKCGWAIPLEDLDVQDFVFSEEETLPGIDLDLPEEDLSDRQAQDELTVITQNVAFQEPLSHQKIEIQKEYDPYGHDQEGVARPLVAYADKMLEMARWKQLAILILMILLSGAILSLMGYFVINFKYSKELSLDQGISFLVVFLALTLIYIILHFLAYVGSLNSSYDVYSEKLLKGASLPILIKHLGMVYLGLILAMIPFALLPKALFYLALIFSSIMTIVMITATVITSKYKAINLTRPAFSDLLANDEFGDVYRYRFYLMLSVAMAILIIVGMVVFRVQLIAFLRFIMIEG